MPLDFIKKRPLIFLIILLLLPLVILVVGSLASQAFYDEVAFRYFWGPIEADRHTVYDRITGDQIGGDYNIVNTLTYGLMAIAGAVATYFILRRHMKEQDTKPDLWFFLALTPIIVSGAVFRVLEDGEVFRGPFVYAFITPIIYAILWAITLLLAIYTFQLLGLYKRRREGTCPLERSNILKELAKIPGFLYFIPPFFVMLVFYCVLYWFLTDWYVVLPHPILAIVLAALFLGALYYIQKQDLGSKLSFFTVFTFYSVFPMLIGLAMLIQWPNNAVWHDHYIALPDTSYEGLNLMEFPIVFGLALLCTVIISAPCFLLRKKFTALKAFVLGPNLLILFGHFLDASATYRAIDHHGYTELHVLPDTLIQLTGTALVMFPIKALIIILFIYLLDIHYIDSIPEDEEKRFNYSIFFGLVKVVVLMVGLAPGLRDVFRLGMGI